jgi:hypothetical protein
MTAAQKIRPESINNSSVSNKLNVTVRVLDDGTRVVDANEIRRELLNSPRHLQALRDFARKHVGK